MTDRDLMQQACAVPLHEQLASVPENARLVIDDADGMGTRFIPVGRMCAEAAAALRERLARQEQEPVAWPCVIAECDFEQDTVTLEMRCADYKVGAGLHWLCTAPQPQQEPVAWPMTVADAVLDTPEPDKWIDCGEARPLPMFHLSTLMQYGGRCAQAGMTSITPDVNTTPQPCPTCEALARAVMCDQTGRA